jgi:hypothetical protein
MSADPFPPRRRLAARVVSAIGIVAMIAVGVTWWNARRVAVSATSPAPDVVDSTGSTRTARAGSGGSVEAIAAPDARAAAASTAATARAPRVARGQASAARDAFERATNLGALFNALRNQRDPDSLFFAQRALRECMPYLMASGAAGQAPALDRYRPALPDDPMTARRQAAYAALQTRCSGFDLGPDPAAGARSLRDAFASVDDRRAALEQSAIALRRGGAPAEAMDKVRAVTADGDPYAMEQASSVMSALRGRYVFVLDGQVVKPDIVAAGWMIAACDAGRSCGDEWVQAPCAFLTECDARDLESSLQRYQLTPSEYDAMQQVRMRIARGLASGQWDPALFAPQTAPPGYRRWGP